MSTEYVVLHNDKDNGLVADVVAISSWDGIETIARFLIDHAGAKFVDQLDGPDARILKVRIEGDDLTLVHDDLMGNKLFVEGGGKDERVRSIAKAIQEAIS